MSIKALTLTAFLAALALAPATLRAADPPAKTVYIDFAAGLDSNPGLTPAQPLKHSPGSPNATDNAKSLTLEPGDTILFKGGITYHGSIAVPASGSETAPITFRGATYNNKFGTGRAILDGSERVTHWQPCTSADQCAGNPHWQNIYHAAAPLPAEPFTSNMYQGDKMLWLAQDPNPKDPFYPDLPSGHRKITQSTATTITDPNYFTQPDAAAWNGAWLVIYASPNYPYFVPITAYDPAAHTVTHSAKLTSPSSYAVLNSLSVLDTPGEYVIRESPDKKSTEIFLWPLDAAELAKSGASISTGSTAFDINNKSHITITGFMIQKFTAAKLTAMGVQISKSQFISVIGNDIRFGNHNRTGSIAHGAGIDVSDSHDIRLENNTIADNRRCSGIISNPAKNITVAGNTVSKTGYVGIWFMKTTDSRIIGNTVTDNNGVHANAISVYTKSNNILIANNKVLRSERPLTLQDSPNIIVLNNILVSDGGPALGLWNGDPIDKISVLNNLILGTADGEGIYAVNKVITNSLFQNNIISNFFGEAAIDAKANTFTTNLYLSPNQPLYGPTDKHAAAKDLFTNPDKNDYHPKPSSPAIAAGTTLPAAVIAAWPTFDFTKDLDNRPRPAGNAIDIGPYEHTP